MIAKLLNCIECLGAMLLTCLFISSCSEDNAPTVEEPLPVYSYFRGYLNDEYVCIEQKMNTDEMAKTLSNELSDNGILGIEFNRDRFAASIKEDLEKYKAEQRSNLQ